MSSVEGPIGRSLRRLEDGRFLTGQGRYVDDTDLAGQLHGVVLTIVRLLRDTVLPVAELAIILVLAAAAVGALTTSLRLRTRPSASSRRPPSSRSRSGGSCRCGRCAAWS